MMKGSKRGSRSTSNSKPRNRKLLKTKRIAKASSKSSQGDGGGSSRSQRANSIRTRSDSSGGSASKSTTKRAPARSRRDARSTSRSRLRNKSNESGPTNDANSRAKKRKDGDDGPEAIDGKNLNRRGISKEELLRQLGIDKAGSGDKNGDEENELKTEEHQENIKKLFNDLTDAKDVADKMNMVADEMNKLQQLKPQLSRRKVAAEATKAAIMRIEQNQR